jgi:dTDP-4-amino-4,6-dideoxygalactose transaminase
MGWAALRSAFRAIRTANSSSAVIEKEFAEYLGVRQVVLLSSGKSAMTLLVRALKLLRPGLSSVAISAYTCFSVPAAIVKAGLRPVLVDIDPDTLDFEPASLARALDNPDLLAVVPTHLFGIPADLARLRAMRGSAPVFIVEDAAQALGVRSSDGRRLGSSGDASIFSLGRGKHLSAGGGGFIATCDPQIGASVAALAAALPALPVFGSLAHVAEMAAVEALIDPRLYWLPAGLPFLGLGETVYSTDFELARVDQVCVGALKGWPFRLERANRDRQRTCRAYVRDLGLATPPGRDHPLLRFPLVLRSAAHRAALLSASAGRGLGVSPMYPTAVHQIPELTALFERESLPGAELLASALVTLPTHEFVTAADRRELAALLHDSSQTAAGAATSNAVQSW